LSPMHVTSLASLIILNFECLMFDKEYNCQAPHYELFTSFLLLQPC
jgi:hypothetical protein